jgi:regulator of replication initiation timing
MNVEELKARLRALLHQRDMLRFERDSLELFDLLDEVDEEIQELQKEIRKIA